MPATAHQQLAASAVDELAKQAARTGRLDHAAFDRACDALKAVTQNLRVVQVGDHDPEPIDEAEYDRGLVAIAQIFGAR